jgi:hypothetical protein
MPTAPITSPPSATSTPPGEGIDERRLLGRALRELPRAEAHGERAPGLAVAELEAQEARAVLALEGDDVAAGVEHHDAELQEIALARLGDGAVDDR